MMMIFDISIFGTTSEWKDDGRKLSSSEIVRFLRKSVDDEKKELGLSCMHDTIL
jgi:hypothetical protein